MKKYKNGNMSMSESELQAIIASAVAEALAKQSGGKATKGKSKPTGGSVATKPTTRREALAQWADAKGITEESKAKYKALVNGSSDFYKKHWEARLTDKGYLASVKKLGKSGANKAWHKHICELADIESKK
jgi:hypothetical protein